MTEITRYRLWFDMKGARHAADVQGEWVKWAEVEKLHGEVEALRADRREDIANVIALRQQVEAVRAERDQLRSDKELSDDGSRSVDRRRIVETLKRAIGGTPADVLPHGDAAPVDLTADEALALLEGPSTLREWVGYHFDALARLDSLEAEATSLRERLAQLSELLKERDVLLTSVFALAGKFNAEECCAVRDPIHDYYAKADKVDASSGRHP